MQCDAGSDMDINFNIDDESEEEDEGPTRATGPTNTSRYMPYVPLSLPDLLL
jgi:hypothetical protein